jgi:hypothetical protein
MTLKRINKRQFTLPGPRYVQLGDPGKVSLCLRKVTTSVRHFFLRFEIPDYPGESQSGEVGFRRLERPRSGQETHAIRRDYWIVAVVTIDTGWEPVVAVPADTNVPVAGSMV